MYVCLCHQLTDKQIRAMYRQAETAEQVFELIGQTPVCGQCMEFIESDLRQCRDCGTCPSQLSKSS